MAESTDAAAALARVLGNSVSSVVTINALIRNGITSVEQLRKMTDQDLLKIANIGQGRVNYIRACLAREATAPASECPGGCRVYTKPPCARKGSCVCGGEWWRHGCKHNVRPAWMSFINFDGRITGEIAQVIEEVAAGRGLTPQQIIAELLRETINDRGYGVPERTETDVKVEPMTINAGNGGFHVLTFVADGYGNLVAEDSTGAEKARMPWKTEDEDASSHEEFTKLARQAFNH